MQRDYEYKGYSIHVSVETVSVPALRGVLMRDTGFVTQVEIFRRGAATPQFSPLHLTDKDGRWFLQEVDALMGGYSAGQRIVDDVLNARAV
ncbi:hypothetical protein [Paraburkholderia phosphatilytica]|uniref:hypothetical protein n=1 Tax=Paraburkholderia phosphatilytica TaxID=2282883 RepID=UPI000E5127BF|nr:hypothetical protein [Paraburkholderia phosphatilytica]